MHLASISFVLFLVVLFCSPYQAQKADFIVRQKIENSLNGHDG